MSAHTSHVAPRLPPTRTRPLDGRHGRGRGFSSDSALLRAFLSPAALEALISVAGSGEWRAGDAWVSLAGQVEVHQAVEVVEDFGIAQHGGTPVSVDTTLQFGMGLGNLDLQLVQGSGVKRRLAGVLDVYGVER